MKTKRHIWIVAASWLLIMPLMVLGQSELVAYHGATLVDHPINDADSFMVRVGDDVLHVRLYFVDAPETTVSQAHDARRVQEQARYFGIERPERILWLGDQATAFSREVLSRPFTLYTSMARAPGGANSRRYYGFVVTANGRDLGELLVANGFGRNFGVKRERYDGIPHHEIDHRLRDVEISAMLARRGIWSESNPDLIVKFRAQHREEQQAMQAIMSSAVRMLESPLDINTAAQRDLERIPGIGPVTAGRIIENRPYRSLEALRDVRGIGDRLFESIKPYVTVEQRVTGNG